MQLTVTRVAFFKGNMTRTVRSISYETEYMLPY